MKPTSYEFYEHTRKEPYIIAEIGSTWKVDNGKDDLENCLTCINMAAEYGATAVKFQLFTHKELYGVDGQTKYALPRQFIPRLSSYAEDLCIDFLCSAFSIDGFKYLDPFVSMHKVASSKVGDQRLLDWITDQKKKVLISDGMFDVPVWGNCIPMICAAEYPAQLVDYDLSNAFRYAVYGPWGLSDHTLRPELARMLRANGCSYFEKHVDFILCGNENPDNDHSLTANMFGYYTDQIRKTEVGRPKIVKSMARNKWGDRYVNEVDGYFRPKV